MTPPDSPNVRGLVGWNWPLSLPESWVTLDSFQPTCLFNSQNFKTTQCLSQPACPLAGHRFCWAGAWRFPPFPGHTLLSHSSKQ